MPYRICRLRKYRAMRRDAALVRRLADGTATYGLNVQVRSRYFRILVIDEQGAGLPSPARADRRMGVCIGVGLDVLIDVG